MPKGIEVIKSGLRVQYKKQIDEIGEENRRSQSYALSEKLCSFLERQQGTWALFAPLNDEPNLLSLLNRCPQIQWVFPKVESETQMSFCRVTTKEEMIVSSWGIKEPNCSAMGQIDPSLINGCVVPGIAYDEHGTRLGRGGGYYDRFLMKFKGLKLGVTFDEVLTNEALPREPHDQTMDYVVSSNRWIQLNKNEVISDD